MNRYYRVFLLALFLMILFFLNYFLSGSYAIPTGQSSIWLHAGLLMLVFGLFWIENYFTKPADVVLNGLVVFISLSTMINPPYEFWWNFLRYYSLCLVLISFFVIWTGSPSQKEYDSSFFKYFVYLIVIRLGNAKVIFSLVFLLALVSYFDITGREAKYLLMFWAILLSAKHLEIETLIEKIIFHFRKLPAIQVGSITRVFEPNIVRFKLHDNKTCRKGTLVAFSGTNTIEKDSPIAFVTNQRNSSDYIEIESILFDSNFKEGINDKRKKVVAVNSDNQIIKDRMLNNNVYKQIDSLIGYATKNTNISKLIIEFTKRTNIEEGHLVSVYIENELEIIFQVISGKLIDEQSLESNKRAFTLGEAQQLGVWSESKQGFETYSWVVPENAPVFHIKQDKEVNKIVKKNTVDIGYIPNSNFPANINLNNLILFHTAILGVTGSGKSFLAFNLIEESAKNDIKVVCLDVTGDYKRYLNNPILLNKTGALEQFLNKSENKIGIIEFLDDRIHPISAANIISKKLLEWCKDNRKPDEVKEPVPKVLLVLEEAHTLVPEWNSNPVKELQNTVNNTAQISLQARKYGLGFMVITQRTANVTKSILNQCNTIFAFQAYDETGFDFLEVYLHTGTNLLTMRTSLRTLMKNWSQYENHVCHTGQSPFIPAYR
jgi:hypothetical protein